MKLEVSSAIDELKLQFSASSIVVRDDGQGGAYVIMEPIDIGSKFQPSKTWLGFQIPAQYPYADIYPVFIDANIRLNDGKAFEPPITSGHGFECRPAIQISRRSAAAQNGAQKAVAKILKVLDFLQRL